MEADKLYSYYLRSPRHLLDSSRPASRYEPWRAHSGRKASIGPAEMREKAFSFFNGHIGPGTLVSIGTLIAQGPKARELAHLSPVIHLLCLVEEVVNVVSPFVILRAESLVEFSRLYIRFRSISQLGILYIEVCEQHRRRSLLRRSLLRHFQPFPETDNGKRGILRRSHTLDRTRLADNLPRARGIFGGDLSGFLH